MMIAQNYKLVEEKIAETCEKSGRNRDEIKLIAVSKTMPVSVIEEAFKVGFSNFGENKAQELRDKSSEINLDLNWHFIGHLQSNKVKYVIEPAEYIHSVDSNKLADEIQKRAASIEKVQKILIEVNTSGEDSKFGLSEFDDVLKLIEYCDSLSNVEVCGLMTMAPYTDNEVILRSCFSKLRDLKEKINSNDFRINELSMGMTNDYEIAIEEGATMLRIGTAIFGERNYS